MNFHSCFFLVSFLCFGYIILSIPMFAYQDHRVHSKDKQNDQSTTLPEKKHTPYYHSILCYDRVKEVSAIYSIYYITPPYRAFRINSPPSTHKPIHTRFPAFCSMPIQNIFPSPPPNTFLVTAMLIAARVICRMYTTWLFTSLPALACLGHQAGALSLIRGNCMFMPHNIVPLGMQDWYVLI